jgi:hypothetical protein
MGEEALLVFGGILFAIVGALAVWIIVRDERRYGRPRHRGRG